MSLGFCQDSQMLVLAIPAVKLKGWEGGVVSPVVEGGVVPPEGSWVGC